MTPDVSTEETQQNTTASVFEGLKASFPFPTIRPAQEQALEVIARAYTEDKPITVMELPTGAGKSPLGLATALWSANTEDCGGGAHYLTSQNSLSGQLMGDFEHLGLAQIRGKANYTCKTHETNCDEGSLSNGGKACEDCPYRAAKNYYLKQRLGVTNYTYYLTETMYSKEIGPRDFLILDEAHNIEREILSIVDITITKNRVAMCGVDSLPYFLPDQDEQVRSWLNATFIPKLKAYHRYLVGEIERQSDSGKPIPVSLSKDASGCKSLLTNIDHYLCADDPNEWLAWSDNEGRLIIKPLTAADFAQEYLFDGTPHVVLMSATILDFDTFRRNLGIRRSQAKCFAVPSEFPLKNRRIVHWPVGSMGAKNIEATLPRLAERTTALLKKFASEKGIIHTHSYKINTFLKDALHNTEHGWRIITHTNIPGAREEAIAKHFASPDPTVLMSPSSTEGLDLKDDLSRFQIITKVPYPYLDPYNRARMERDPKWYQLQTALSLVQATGRSIRSKDDYALTVMLDADFGRFLSQNQDILPAWWLESIEFR